MRGARRYAHFSSLTSGVELKMSEQASELLRPEGETLAFASEMPTLRPPLLVPTFGMNYLVCFGKIKFMK